MTNVILDKIRLNTSIDEIQKYIERKKEMIPLFVPLNELKNQSLFEHLIRYQKLYHWPLEHFITYKVIDFHELSPDGKNLMQHLLELDDLTHFQYVLLAGQKPSENIYLQSEGTKIGAFLRYKPGRNNPSVYDHLIKKKPDLKQLENLIFDFVETTDEESTDAELSESESLTPEEELAYKKNQTNIIAKYNSTQEDAESLRFVAARGVHFVKKHFQKKTKELVHTTRHDPHTTYSFSTLIDSGYLADNEPDEKDKKILCTHQRNLKFIDTLKITPDKKEKSTAHRKPPASRNKREFESLFWREIQVYINSYDALFNLKGIQINFSFASNNNPHLSLSWKTKVAGMYAGGVRFGWKRGERFDPHYRRYDGKPKHPTVGYIDVFELPLDYVRENGVDRLLAYNNGKIDLSNIHLAEAEIIFHSMIPKAYHLRRYMVVLPSFENPVSKSSSIEERYFGMKGAGSYTRARNGLFNSMEKKLKETTYQDWVTKRTEHAVTAQSQLIDNAMELRLFKAGKVRAFDHGNTISASLPTPKL